MAIPKHTTYKEKDEAVGPHWQSQLRRTFTVDSDFKTDAKLQVTVIVQDDTRGNRFWSKHVLRRAETPHDVLYMRDAIKSGKGDPNYAQFHFGDKIEQGVSGSTVVRMDRIDERAMYYRFAYALVKAMNAGHFGDTSKAISAERVDLVVDFKVAQCVHTLKYPKVPGSQTADRQQAPVMTPTQAMKVTAVQKSLLDDDEICFEIDHCHYACEPDGQEA